MLSPWRRLERCFPMAQLRVRPDVVLIPSRAPPGRAAGGCAGWACVCNQSLVCKRAASHVGPHVGPCWLTLQSAAEVKVPAHFHTLPAAARGRVQANQASRMPPHDQDRPHTG